MLVEAEVVRRGCSRTRSWNDCGFPEISREELFRYFTLTPADLAFVDPGRGRGPAERLGLAIALCTLPWLGFVPDRLVTAPPVAVARVAEQLRLGSGGDRCLRQASQDPHRACAPGRAVPGWRAVGALEFKELDEFLLARAMEHDSPTLLFRLACEYLISAKVIRPGPVTVVERVAHARHQAQTETYDRLAHEFTAARCASWTACLSPTLRWGSRGCGGCRPGRWRPRRPRSAPRSTSWVSCAGWALIGWICRCCPPSGAGFWPRWPAPESASAATSGSATPVSDPAHGAGPVRHRCPR
ncbi:DUF4158 domain-containing protein [Rhodococcus hoagii]|nr:DUF4158 domain-containing protein [Prescottella equi]